MAINRFDQPAQAKFINTYVPLPTEELKNAALARQAKHDENLARLDQTRAAADQLKYIPNSEDQKYIHSVRSTMDQIADKYLDKDLSDPEIYRALRSDLRGSIDQSKVNDIQQSYLGWESNQKIAADLKRRGLYHEGLDMDPARLSAYDTSQSGIYGYQQESLLDARKAAEQYFDDLKASSNIDWKNGIIQSGVYDSDIQRVTNEKIRDFMDTNEGRQVIQLAAYREGIDLSSLDREEKRLLEESMARQFLNDVGEEFIYNQKTPLPASYLRNNLGYDPNVRPLLTKMQGTRSGKLNEDILDIGVTSLSDKDFDSNGNLIERDDTDLKSSLSRASNRVLIGAPSAGMPNLSQQPEVSSKDQYQKFKNMIAEVKDNFPQLSGESDEEVINAYKQLSKSASNFRMSYSDMTSEQREAWGQAASLDLGNRTIEFYGDNGEKILGAMTDDTRKSPLRRLGFTEGDFAKALRGELPNDDPRSVRVMGFDMGSSDIPGAIKLQVIDKNGNEHAVNITGWDQTNDYMSPVTNIRQTMTSMQNGMIGFGQDVDGDLIGVEVIPKAVKTKKGYEYKPELRIGKMDYDPTTGSSNGFIEGTEVKNITLPELYQFQFNKMMFDPTIGLDINNLGSKTNVR